MQFQGKAFYNLLRLKPEGSELLSNKDHWQVEDYRKLTTSELLAKLSTFGILLTEETFVLYANEFESPESLTEGLLDEESTKDKTEKTYLVLFELWRRLCPQRQSLSIFCDELDQQIALYDAKELRDEEKMQELFKDLENILDEYVDEGGDPHEAFASVSSFCAHDLESFLYDYSSDLIDKGFDTYASELVDGFYEYVEDRRWLDFLRARLVGDVDEAEMVLMIGRLLDGLEEECDLDLVIEIAKYLSAREYKDLFLRACRLVSLNLETEEDFLEFVDVIDGYVTSLDDEAKQKVIKELKEQNTKDLEEAFSPKDARLKKVLSLLN